VVDHSTRGRVIAPHRSEFTDPLVFRAGEPLRVTDKETEWQGWVWCTSRAGKSGWAPEAYVRRDGDAGLALVDYDATELSVDVGQELLLNTQESGWIWCTDQAGQGGWVPADKVERIEQ
jgi:uncharacterized protein YgiM (DUF1202 family)